MLKETLIAMLWSVSPLGEAKVGIPYGLLQGVNPYVVFVTCLAANIMVFPIMQFFLEKINHYFLRWRNYKRPAIWVARRAKSGAGNKIRRFGFLGLVLFVMIPLPGTGVYAGTIAAYILSFPRKKAFWANVIGITISSAIVWGTTLLSIRGVG